MMAQTWILKVKNCKLLSKAPVNFYPKRLPNLECSHKAPLSLIYSYPTSQAESERIEP